MARTPSRKHISAPGREWAPLARPDVCTVAWPVLLSLDETDDDSGQGCQDEPVHLTSPTASLTLSVTGYQFPDAEDHRLRCSWHMLAGEAVCPEGTWRFRWQALACNESPLIADWLRSVAEWAIVDRPRSQRPERLEFTEPNLAFHAMDVTSGVVALAVAFDLEFRPPWDPSRFAGNPYPISLQVDEAALVRAAAEWDREISRYPDLTPPTAES